MAGPAPGIRVGAGLSVRQWLLASPTASIVVFAVGLRVATAFLAFLANIVFPLHQRQAFSFFQHPHAFWDTFARYDSSWYLGIARNGYEFAEGGRSNLAFFPLYPLLMGVLGRPFGTRSYHYYSAGIAISWVAFVVAMIVLYRLARLDVSRRAAHRAVVYAALFPFAFFYGIVYSESLFLMLALLAVYGFRTRRWLMGGVAGALATATRVNGIMMLPALAWMGWQAARDDRRQRVYAMVAVAFSSTGLAVYSVYAYTLSGSFVEWYHSITRWNAQPYQPGMGFGVFVGLARALLTRPYSYLTQEHAAPYDLLNGGVALLFLAMVPFLWRRLGIGYGLFMLANLALPMSSEQFEGLGRYCAVLFPAFIWLGTFRAPVVQAGITAGFAMAYLLCLSLFVNLYPIF